MQLPIRFGCAVSLVRIASPIAVHQFSSALVRGQKVFFTCCDPPGTTLVSSSSGVYPSLTMMATLQAAAAFFLRGGVSDVSGFGDSLAFMAFMELQNQ